MWTMNGFHQLVIRRLCVVTVGAGVWQASGSLYVMPTPVCLSVFWPSPGYFHLRHSWRFLIWGHPVLCSDCGFLLDASTGRVEVYYSVDGARPLVMRGS